VDLYHVERHASPPAGRRGGGPQAGRREGGGVIEAGPLVMTAVSNFTSLEHVACSGAQDMFKPAAVTDAIEVPRGDLDLVHMDGVNGCTLNCRSFSKPRGAEASGYVRPERALDLKLERL
jgi:hypothetical protein